MRCRWSEAPINHPLSDDEIHLWCADLNETKNSITNYQNILSPDELERAGRYHFEKDRNQYIIRRGILRKLLGGYLDIRPTQLIINYTQYGKPFLVSPERTIQFNLSHSQGLALFGFGLQHNLGVDLEYIRRDFEFEPVAYRYFSSYEQDILRSVPAELQAWAFYACWTRKEAYIKAQGKGLSIPLESFDVSLKPGEEARLIATRPDVNESQKWMLYHLDPAPGFQGAIAWSTTDHPNRTKIQCWCLEYLT